MARSGKWICVHLTEMLQRLVVATVLASSAAKALDSLVAASVAPARLTEISKKTAMMMLLRLRLSRRGSRQLESAGPWAQKALPALCSCGSA